MKALVKIVVKTFGSTCAPPLYIMWAGVQFEAVPLFLPKVSSVQPLRWIVLSPIDLSNNVIYDSLTAVEHKYTDWKDFLVKRLTGARTLPSTFYNKVHESLKSRFR